MRFRWIRSKKALAAPLGLKLALTCVAVATAATTGVVAANGSEGSEPGSAQAVSTVGDAWTGGSTHSVPAVDRDVDLAVDAGDDATSEHPRKKKSKDHEQQAAVVSPESESDDDEVDDAEGDDDDQAEDGDDQGEDDDDQGEDDDDQAEDDESGDDEGDDDGSEDDD
jgi:hypothetical protein